jgi:hypothetical protein
MSVRSGQLGLPWHSSGLLGVLLGSRMFLALRWTTLEKVLGVGAMRRWLYMEAKPSYVGAGVDGLACSMHRPTVYGWQAWVQHFLIGTALFHYVAVVGDAFSGVRSPRA